ncbi:MAG: alpha/beta fold hydrolase [Syntrophaceae bacterium]|nr:alpha/beta fold hydrolase [Syntrophaceae bacterium]
MYPDRCIDVNGARTRFLHAGEAGPPVVLIHGLGASAEIWSANIGALAERHRVFVPDLPGFGRTAMPPGMGFSPAAYSRFIRDFMTALGIGQAALVGHSLGGGVALRVILDEPGRVDRLVLASSAGLGQDISLPLRIASLPLVDRLFVKPPLPVFTRFLHRLVHDPSVITPGFARMCYEMFFRPGAVRAFTGILRAVATIRGARPGILEPIREGLGTIAVPTLILWGRQDRILPVGQALDAAGRIPGARLHIFERCGHMPNVEYPEAFNRLVLDFLNGGRG